MATRTRRHTASSEQLAAAEAEIIDRSRRIDFYTTEYSVELLANKMQNGEFVIPDYQRAYTWESKRKSRFIESLIMGLPIPFLFFWEMDNGKLEIVDGSQRLRTLQEYILGELELTGLEELESLNGTHFNDLSLSRQRKIKNRSIRGIVLNEHADDQARFDMFDRINTGSKVANTSEVRRGALRGKFQQLVEELAEIRIFQNLAPMSDKSIRERIREEMITRYFAYGDGLDSYRDSPSRFTFEYTRKMNAKFEENPALIQQYRDRFIHTLEFVAKAFPQGFRKSSNPNTTPRVRFEAISIGSYLALRANPKIFNKVPNTASWIESASFKDVTTSDAANVRSKLEGRINYVRNALLEG